MSTAQAMRAQGFRYFSSLTPVQKDTTIYLIVKAKLGLLGMSATLSASVMSEMTKELIETRELVERQLKRQKCFVKDGIYYPLNVREILLNNATL
jgi:hypothetical protein